MYSMHVVNCKKGIKVVLILPIPLLPILPISSIFLLILILARKTHTTDI